MFDSLTTDSRANWLFQSEFLRFAPGEMRFCPSERKPRVNAVFSGRIRRTAPGARLCRRPAAAASQNQPAGIRLMPQGFSTCCPDLYRECFAHSRAPLTAASAVPCRRCTWTARSSGANIGCVSGRLRFCELCENVSNFCGKCLPADAIRAKSFRQTGMNGFGS
jgi:hypothetical protein